MSTAQDKISVEELKKISVLYEGDIYELAQLLLKVNDAREKPPVGRTRQTVRGLATAYCNLAHVDFDQIISVFEKHRLPLGATVEHERDIG